MNKRDFFVSFQYCLDENTFSNFIKAVLPFTRNLQVKELNEYYVGPKSSSKRLKRVIQNEEIMMSAVKEILLNSPCLSTGSLFKKFVKHTYWGKGYKTFTRLLFKMAVLGTLAIRKEKKDNGGFHNIWWLK